MMFPHPNDISSFFAFSPPSQHHGSLQDIFFPATAASAGSNPSRLLQPPPPATAAATAAPQKTASDGAVPPPLTGRRRPRKDRHSKIHTAQGPRDRRMRLSLDVARKFFDLQDLLGFDKASKTVQWLLNMSKTDIKELVAASKREASTSECEEDISTVSNSKCKTLPATKAPKRAVEVRNMRSRKSVKPKVARECRDKARAKARERTLEKKMMMQCGRQEEGSQGSKDPLVLEAIACGGLQEESSSHELKSSVELVAEMDEHCSITSPIHHKESHDNGSIAIFDYNHAVESLFQDPWEMNFTENIDERVLLGEFPLQMSYGRLIIPPVFDHL